MQSSPSVTVAAAAPGKTSHYSTADADADAAAAASSGQEIRSRLLRRLGIHEEDTITNGGTTGMMEQQQQQRPVVQPFQVPLKNKDHDNNNKTQDDEKKSLKFVEEVAVVPIPMRTEYSSRIKSRLWCDRQELHDMAQRNLVEFEFEGYNSCNVIEESSMIVGITGELIHPVHCRTLLQHGHHNNLKRGGHVGVDWRSNNTASSHRLATPPPTNVQPTGQHHHQQQHVSFEWRTRHVVCVSVYVNATAIVNLS